MAKNFKDLSEREILALAISLEEEHGRIFGDFVDGLSETYPATAKMFEAMQAEESEHRRALIDLYRQRFGEHIPLIRRHDVKGFVTHRPLWLVRPLGINAVRKQAEIMIGIAVAGRNLQNGAIQIFGFLQPPRFVRIDGADQGLFDGELHEVSPATATE